MKSRSLLSLSLFLLASPILTTGAFAQKTTITERVLDKIGKADVLYNILPLLLTKKQILDLLPTLEKARDNVRKTMAKEDQMFESIEAIADAAYQRAIEKNVLPSEEDRAKMSKALFAFRTQRNLAANENVDLVQPVFDRITNAGQRKVAVNTLNIKVFLPDAKPEEMSDEAKERLFIRYILLDSAAYEMLTDMAKARKE